MKYQDLGCGKPGGSADALSVGPSNKEQAKMFGLKHLGHITPIFVTNLTSLTYVLQFYIFRTLTVTHSCPLQQMLITVFLKCKCK